jgi:hypothetical protein
MTQLKGGGIRHHQLLIPAKQVLTLAVIGRMVKALPIKPLLTLAVIGHMGKIALLITLALFNKKDESWQMKRFQHRD